MKKLMTLAAVVAACAPAFTAEVTSSNIVGYQKLNLVSGLNLVAVPFVAPGGSVADVNEAMASADLQTGTVAMYWDALAKTYSTIYYYDVNSDGGIYTDDSYEECIGPGWGDANQIVVEQPTVRGEGFWVQAQNASVNTFLGEVNTNMVSVSLTTGLNLVGNPFPSDISIQKIVSSDLKTGTLAMFWDPQSKNYVTAYYYDKNSDGGVYTDDTYEECLGPGWGDANQVSIDMEIDSLDGFWIQSEDAASIGIKF